jgi:CHRD domain
MRRLLVGLILVTVAGMILPGIAAAQDTTFVANLRPASEVPPCPNAARNAVGTAVFELSEDATQLTYRLVVNNTASPITAAHIHLAPEGQNGPVVAFLFGPSTGVESNGLLASGVITAADLTGPLTGQPLSTLVAAIQQGNTYANVHTTGCPGGEIRGQIRTGD